ncbi:hypothetical protein PMIN03_011489 [Paraphaeosphaeria minitans]
MMPFSREEDDIESGALLFLLFTNALADPIHRYGVLHHSDTHFPFLTAQWKAAMSGDNRIDARLQAARDGALIVNYMHQFYSYTYPDRDPSQLETCHVSPTTEMIVEGRGGNAEDPTQLQRLRDSRTFEVYQGGASPVLAKPVRETGKEKTVAKLGNYVEFELAVRYAHDAFEL